MRHFDTAKGAAIYEAREAWQGFQMCKQIWAGSFDSVSMKAGI